jgi:hypothetical protein
MALQQMYVQCELSKPIEDGGVARMVSWIRREVALPGRLLRGLEDTDTGRVETGWRVDSAGGAAKPEQLLMKRSRDYTKQRKASDI